jgi:hypothetical protein
MTTWMIVAYVVGLVLLVVAAIAAIVREIDPDFWGNG